MYASLDDVSSRLGRPVTDADEVAQILAWVGDAERLILRRLTDLPERIIAGQVTGEDVAMVVANAVIRKVKNPDGYVSEAIDDHNYRLNENARKGEVFITDEEWALLAPASAVGAFTITPYAAGVRGVWVQPDAWVPLP